MRLTFVTGPSCSGKTTLHDRLVAAGQDHVREIDKADPFPSAGHVEWLRWRALEYVTAATRRAADEQRRDEHHVVTGIVWPFEVLDSDACADAFDEGVEVRFVLLDRHFADVEEDTIARLCAEGWYADDIQEQVVINRIQGRRLRRQFAAIAQGAFSVEVKPGAVLAGGLGIVIPDGDLDTAAALVASDASW